MSKKILIIDDDKGLLQLLSNKLSATGYEILIAENGVEGLEVLETLKPDLIILDVMMPEMDGYSFIQESKTRELIEQKPVIILTANQDVEDIFKAEGVFEYLVKPFDPRELLEKIKELLK